MDMHPRARDVPPSDLDAVIPDEAELTAGVRIRPGRSYGFFTDTTLCIGCKACEVACKEWNNLPAETLGLTGHSYDNTDALSANTWRHVSFIEQAVRDDSQTPFQSGWLMMSDVCKHCHNAPCVEACPTGRAVPHRVRHRRGAAGHLQRLRLLRAGLPVRGGGYQPAGRQGAQVHACATIG